VPALPASKPAAFTDDDQRMAVYSLTSVARARIDGGTVRPQAAADAFAGAGVLCVGGRKVTRDAWDVLVRRFGKETVNVVGGAGAAIARRLHPAIITDPKVSSISQAPGRWSERGASRGQVWGPLSGDYAQ
jgi:hypothetical protein